jgi:hypothetical protein
VICVHCRVGGDLNSQGDWYAAKQAHLRCTDLNCSCQHDVGDRWVRV